MKKNLNNIIIILIFLSLFNINNTYSKNINKVISNTTNNNTIHKNFLKNKNKINPDFTIKLKGHFGLKYNTNNDVNSNLLNLQYVNATITEQITDQLDIYTKIAIYANKNFFFQVFNINYIIDQNSLISFGLSQPIINLSFEASSSHASISGYDTDKLFLFHQRGVGPTYRKKFNNNIVFGSRLQAFLKDDKQKSNDNYNLNSISFSNRVSYFNYINKDIFHFAINNYINYSADVNIKSFSKKDSIDKNTKDIFLVNSGLEFAFNIDSINFQSNLLYTNKTLLGKERKNYNFINCFFEISYFLTGESKNYDTMENYFTGITKIKNEKIGAIEMAFKFGYGDLLVLTDPLNNIEKISKATVGIGFNYFLNNNLKFLFEAGNTNFFKTKNLGYDLKNNSYINIGVKIFI